LIFKSTIIQNREKIMMTHLTKQHSARTSTDKLTDTSLFLFKAQNGEIPLATLENVTLDKREVSLLLSRELLFWYSAAQGAKMTGVAAFFYELHQTLMASAKNPTKA
jgi:hypothetical protein